MKSKVTSLVLIILATSIAEGSAQGASKLKEKLASAIFEKPEQKVSWQQYDTNQDGELRRSEIAAWETSLSLAVIARFDRNEDGRWDDQERRTALYALIRPMLSQKDPGAQFKGYDQNADGKLDQAERVAIRNAQTARKQAAVAEFDKDHNGRLDEKEKAAQYSAWRQKLRAQQEAIFGEAIGLQSKQKD